MTSDPEIAKLRREVRHLKGLCAATLCALLLLLLSGFQGTPREQVLRARGLVIEDAEGRDRILIGAPLPASPQRIRTDPAKARAAWGGRYPDLDFYSKLEHATNGLLILDANGHDRIAIGDPTPDPNTGKRIAPAVGIAINDAEGFERSGWGHFPSLGRTGLGLDHASGEGVNLLVLEDGSAGLLVRDAEGARQTFVGQAPRGHAFTGIEEAVHGFVIRDAGGPRMVLDATGHTPRIELREADGTRILEIPVK